MNSAFTPACVSGMETRVVSNEQICRAHARLVLKASDFPESEPGQFVHICCNSLENDDPRCVETDAEGWPVLSQTGGCGDRQAFLRRPFSISDRWRDERGGTRLAIVSRTVGAGTAWLERLKPGDTVNLTGPLGRGFRIPDEDTPLIVIGGGVGIPPLIYLTRRLTEIGKREVVGFFGAVTSDLLPLTLTGAPAADGAPTPCVELGGDASYPVAVTTDDGTLGMRGVTTDALRKWLEQRTKRGGLVFACGPEPMLAAVADMTRAHGLECQLCIERMMGCGLGGCLSCNVRVHDESRTERWRWALTCKDGPVFDRDRLVGRRWASRK